MATTNFKGQPVKLIGEFIQVGKVAPDFELVKSDLSSFALKDLKGKNIVLNIFPSLDTGVCATSVRKFNKMAAGMKDTVVLAISKDLPFAQGRFCTTEGIENVIPLSDFRFSDFDESYGVRMADGPLAGLLARAVVVIGKDGKVAYTELVPEITQEPDYEKAFGCCEIIFFFEWFQGTESPCLLRGVRARTFHAGIKPVFTGFTPYDYCLLRVLNRQSLLFGHIEVEQGLRKQVPLRLPVPLYRR